MANLEQREAIKSFINKWTGKGNEKEHDQTFWNDILQSIFAVRDSSYIEYQKPVKVDGTTKWIDAYIPSTKVLIEQKSLGVALNRSGNDGLTPYEQAKRYANNLPVNEHPKYIITSNFSEFWIYDMDKPGNPPEIVKLADLEKDFTRLGFLVDSKNDKIEKEKEISLEAGKRIAKIYDVLEKLYVGGDEKENDEALNMLCVRLVFCFYAEDADVFGKKDMFYEYMKQFDAMSWRSELIRLFSTLNTKPENRDPYLRPDLAEFPYVNGGLFEGDIIIPQFTDELVNIILEQASRDFDWSDISPTIFGAAFESTLNPETRRAGGMHYTSIENIHKVIDPLFLDELKEELVEIKAISVKKTRNQKLKEFQDKIAGLIFLDPACGSGNFLTETYLSLRKLENEVLEDLLSGQIGFVFDEEDSPIKVSINQFYGIEINDFAVEVARTALWIAESQMLEQTEHIVHHNIDFLPLTTNASIIEGNALRIDWNDVIDKNKLNYIMGNPPFVANNGRTSASNSHSAGMQDATQKEDKENLFGKEGGVLDYVACWYKKASEYMRNTVIESAFVSTDSICQGQQVVPLWRPIFEAGIVINFAYEFFPWKSEASSSATVFVVIIGFSYKNREIKKIFNKNGYSNAKNINAYLVDAENIYIEKRKLPICNVSKMTRGSQPTDAGYLILSNDERSQLIKKYPKITKYIRPFMMGSDMIDGDNRYCLWLYEANPKDISSCKEIVDRIEAVRRFRLSSTKEATRKKADTPMLFDEIKQPNSDYLAYPIVSSSNRRYVPIEYYSSNIIAGNKLFIVPNATYFEFGVMTSNIHMAWMRATCSYYGPSYQYSNTIVYNNFPWPTPTDEQKSKIETTAQGILDARAKYPDSSLADLYDPNTMPKDLLDSHRVNDKAVMEAYGFSTKMTEQECVAKLMKMYQDLTNDN